MNSRAKGCRGEREFRDVLRAAGFCKARRTQQYCGRGPDASDVTCPELPSLHFEVKRVQRGNVYDWIDQAERDAGRRKVPVVAHKRNNCIWLAVVRMDDFLALLKETERVQGRGQRSEDGGQRSEEIGGS